jgi:hypothetical protein
VYRKSATYWIYKKVPASGIPKIALAIFVGWWGGALFISLGGSLQEDLELYLWERIQHAPYGAPVFS